MVLKRLNPAYFAEYGIPVDEPELDRMDLNHHKYTLLQEKLFMAPMTQTPSKILDLGTGSGEMLQDCLVHF